MQGKEEKFVKKITNKDTKDSQNVHTLLTECSHFPIDGFSKMC